MRALLLRCALLAWTPFPVSASSLPLALDEAIDLALSRQPLIEAQTARVQAAQARAAAADALPDPQFVAGIDNLPLGELDPYAADAEPMTMTSVGLMQEFPNAAKRRGRARYERLAADGADAGRGVLERRVARDTALAWIEAWQPQQALALIEPLAKELQRSRDAASIDLRSGRAAQSAVHAATVAQALVSDRQLRAQQELDAARARLARWIGDAAERPLAPPTDAALPPQETTVAALDAHPQLRMAALAADAAQAGVDLARSAYRPDWRIQAMYGYRRPYDDMVSVQVGIDLPLFTANRQDRGLAAAQAEEMAARADREALHRELSAQAAAAYRGHSALQARLAEYDASLLPAAESRADAALASYRSGAGALAEVLDARTQLHELQLMRLELQAELLRQTAQLHYLLPGARS